MVFPKILFQGQPYVKDLSILGRDMTNIVLVDNNPAAMVYNFFRIVLNPFEKFYHD